MDSLPQELINRIAYYSERYVNKSREGIPAPLQHSPFRTSGSKFPPLATLSRKWKEAIETITYARLRWVRSDEFDRFQAIMTGNRCQFLRYLDYQVVLPDDNCSEEELIRMEPESEQQQHANN
jgi:hypothetical protein